jgi:3',5'-cyclic AMP phosphodiesterase CpdA
MSDRRTFLQQTATLSAILATPGLVPGDTPSGKPLDAAPEGTFSFAIIPDTHLYLGKETKAEPESQNPVTNPVFETTVRWILEERERQKIAFVSHVGDIVDLNLESQWSHARILMNQLRGKLPFAISPGNHDMEKDGDSTLFQKTFPAGDFKEFRWYGGSYANPKGEPFSGNNANSFQLPDPQTTGGEKLLLLHLECNAPAAVLKWADQLLKKYADRTALITTHMLLGPLQRPANEDELGTIPRGWMKWSKVHGKNGTTPEQMWDLLFRKHKNIKVIFCGDQSKVQAQHETRKTDATTPVHAALSDYWGYQLRICRFHPKTRKVEIRTVDPRNGTVVNETKKINDPGEHNFDVTY